MFSIVERIAFKADAVGMPIDALQTNAIVLTTPGCLEYGSPLAYTVRASLPSSVDYCLVASLIRLSREFSSSRYDGEIRFWFYTFKADTEVSLSGSNVYDL